jgi:hypothetical protein
LSPRSSPDAGATPEASPDCVVIRGPLACPLTPGTCSSPPSPLPVVVGSRLYLGVRPATTYHLPHTVYVLCFQRHSRFIGLSAFVFTHIPALPPSFPQRSFVFIDIPASSVHFLKLLRSSWHREAVTCCRFGEKGGGVIGEVSRIMAEQPGIISLGYHVKHSLSRLFLGAGSSLPRGRWSKSLGGIGRKRGRYGLRYSQEWQNWPLPWGPAAPNENSTSHCIEKRVEVYYQSNGKS